MTFVYPIQFPMPGLMPADEDAPMEDFESDVHTVSEGESEATEPHGSHYAVLQATLIFLVVQLAVSKILWSKNWF